MNYRSHVSATFRRRPWADVAPELVSPLAAVLQETIDATIHAIGTEVPSYRDFASGAMAATVRKGVEIALARLLDLIGRDAAALDGRARTVYERIGAGEWRQGRTMEALLAAYRTGARVAWERMSAAVVAAGASSGDIVALAEAIFVYIDELSAASAAGHADAQSADAGRREALRSRLAELVLAGSGESEAARTLADEVGWTPGPSVVVALADATGPAPDDGSRARWPPATLPVGALVGEAGERVAVVLPALGDSRGLAAAGICVAVGPPRRLAEATGSLRGAERLLELRVGGAVPAAPVLLATDHLPELVLAADPAMQAELREDVLAPLAQLPHGKAQALARTLLAWLLSDGDRALVARQLAVHPQTVTYRLARLRELFGEDLGTPRQRLALVLALAGQPANSTVTGA